MSNTRETATYSIGAFTLKVANKGLFTVTQFHLAKGIGVLSQCTVTISDCTQMIKINTSNYPLRMGDIKLLFTLAIKTLNIGTLMDVTLILHRTKDQKIWFIGKLCAISPSLDTTYGVLSGLQCLCTGSACLLMYSPIADFIYVPQQLAKDVDNLKSAGVFDSKLLLATFAASNKPLVQDIAKDVGDAKQPILDFINKCLHLMLRRRQTKGLLLGDTTVDLTKYFLCDIRLSDTFANLPSIGAHPYVDSLILDLYNGLQSTDIFTAIISALTSHLRHLTFIPSTIELAQKGKDKLKLWPSYIEPVKDFLRLISMDLLLNCSVGVDPIDHLKTPTLLYVRAAKFDIWSAQSKLKLITKNSDVLGGYILPGAKAPYRFQVLDIPSWILNTIIELQKKEFKAVKGSRLANSLSLEELVARLALEKKGVKEQTVAVCKLILNRVAKTKYFNTYLMSKKATLSLAVALDTLNLDSYLGKSLAFLIPLQAAQLGKIGLVFYGRLLNISYTFTAAKTPQAKSNLTISCSMSGVTSIESPAASIFIDDDPFFIYKRG